MNYQIVKDEESLKRFIDWLPELTEDEVYYLVLFARPKYSPKVKLIHNKKQVQLKRIVTSKERMFQKIKQLEVEVGAYTMDTVPIPEESLVLYININPRSKRKAAKKMLTTLTETLTNPGNHLQNPHSLALTEIHRACSRKLFYDIDFDISTDEKNFHELFKQRREIEDKLIEYTQNSVRFLNTRGGFHALVDLQSIPKEVRSTWYQKISSLEGIDIKGDNMIPVPGTSQGGYTPFFYTLEVYK